MKKPRLHIAATAVLGLAAGLFFFIPKAGLSPKTFTQPTLESIINVHGSPEQGLRICGKRFRRVKGWPPYYVAVTNSSLVLFAYEPSVGEKVLVVCSTNDCTFREIPLKNVVWGDDIGRSTPSNGEWGISLNWFRRTGFFC